MSRDGDQHNGMSYEQLQRFVAGRTAADKPCGRALRALREMQNQRPEYADKGESLGRDYGGGDSPREYE